MRFRAKSAIASGAAAAVLSLGAVPAVAASGGSTVRDSGSRSYVNGCFSIKIYDGNFTDTIYYRNRCSHKQQLAIIYGSSKKKINVGAKKKGSWYSSTTNIADAYDNS